MESEKRLLLVRIYLDFNLSLSHIEALFDSCFNAFSRVDVRLDVKIPGGVSAYVLDLRGERCGNKLYASFLWFTICSYYRHEPTPEIWQETYVSALLRAILYSDDPTYYLEAYRKLDPVASPEDELRFLQAAEALFMKGSTALYRP